METPKRRRKRWQRGSIYRRGERFSIVYRRPDGTQKWESGFPTKGRAQDRLTEVMGQITKKTFTDPQDILFEQWCAEWLERKKTECKPSTWGSYHSAVHKWLIPKFGERYVCDITRISVIGFFDELQNKDRSRKFVRNVYVLLHKIFKDALYRGHHTLNPADGIELQQIESAEHEVLKPEEVVKTFARLPRAYQALLACGSMTGMRRAELLGLRWEDIDFDSGMLHVRRTLQRVKKSLLDAEAFENVERIGNTGLALISPKSKKSIRPLEIPPKLVVLLRELRRTQNGSPFVFQDNFGAPLDPDGVYEVLHQAQGKAKVRRFGLHALRHLYCSLLQESGASVKHAQERMGHASATTTMNIYTHTVNDEGRKYAEKVEASFPFVSYLLASGSAEGVRP